MPGLVDTHIHAPQYVFTGTGYDLPLLGWLEMYTFPTEAKFEQIEFATNAYHKVVVSESQRKANYKLATTTAIIIIIIIIIIIVIVIVIVVIVVVIVIVIVIIVIDSNSNNNNNNN